MVKRTEVGNHLIDPQRIRALATGVGQTQQRSKVTGERRAAHAVECMPPGVHSKSIGYPPAPEPMMAGVYRYDPDGPLPADGEVR